MSWQAVGDILEGNYLLGDPKGCRDCGTIRTHKHPNGLIIEYPGVECCIPAIRRQIKWRSGDLDALNKQVSDRLRAVEELKAKAGEDRHLLGYAAQAARAYDALMRPGTGEWDIEIKALSTDIKRLRAKLEAMEKAA